MRKKRSILYISLRKPSCFVCTLLDADDDRPAPTVWRAATTERGDDGRPARPPPVAQPRRRSQTATAPADRPPRVVRAAANVDGPRPARLKSRNGLVQLAARVETTGQRICYGLAATYEENEGGDGDGQTTRAARATPGGGVGHYSARCRRRSADRRADIIAANGSAPAVSASLTSSQCSQCRR